MNVGHFAMLVLRGVPEAWRAGLVMKCGGYGLIWDIILGPQAGLAGIGERVRVAAVDGLTLKVTPQRG